MTRRRIELENEPLPPMEYLSHGEDCGCGCQLTEAQWRLEAENDAGLGTVDFDGSYTLRSETRT